MKMMRCEKIIWCLLIGVLVLLFLLSPTGFTTKEEQMEICPVSIITGNTMGNYYSNLREGVDRAADEYNVDINFITLHEKGSITEQMDLLKRGVDGGARAVVLVLLKQEECRTILEEMVLVGPPIVMGNIFPGSWAMTGISQGYQEVDRMLGGATTEENTPDKPVLLFTEGLGCGYNREAYAGLLNALFQAGFQVHFYETNRNGTSNTPSEGHEDFFRWAMETHMYPDSGEAIIAALGVESLERVADIIAGNPVNMISPSTLCDFGSTTKILNQMGRDVIKGLIATSQFDAGYLNIVKAINTIERRGDRGQTVLEPYYMEEEDLQKVHFEETLYPIE